jgi:hypothetical protein
VFILDRLLVGSLRFVLDKVAAAVDQEMNDEERLREELLSAQMRNELGEITDEEFTGIERAVLARLREIREARETPSEGYRVTGVDATVGGDDVEE